ncbi:hypothetical protein ACHAWF_007310 [Thalassiosira exigua]
MLPLTLLLISLGRGLAVTGIWNEQVVCLTVDQCRKKYQSMNTGGGFYVNSWATKGCFMKGSNIFFGTGGTVDQMLETDLNGVQERVWCNEEESFVAPLPEDADPSKEPTDGPTKKPTLNPTDSPTKEPTQNPSKLPTASPVTDSPTKQPTRKPVTDSPTRRPTYKPTTESPTKLPTAKPTTESPTKLPTAKPVTESPTKEPTEKPVTASPTTAKPVTESPTKEPTQKPVTERPTNKPTRKPVTESPTMKATPRPTAKTPTEGPTTKSPTEQPSPKPVTPSPTKKPTPAPTNEPTLKPVTIQTTGQPQVTLVSEQMDRDVTDSPTKKPVINLDTEIAPAVSGRPTPEPSVKTVTDTNANPVSAHWDEFIPGAENTPTKKPVPTPVTGSPTRKPANDNSSILCPPAYDTEKTSYEAGELVEVNEIIFECRKDEVNDQDDVLASYVRYCNIAYWYDALLDEDENAKNLWDKAWAPTTNCHANAQAVTSEEDTVVVSHDANIEVPVSSVTETNSPTMEPTQKPVTHNPTKQPTVKPTTNSPSYTPIFPPTAVPTISDGEYPSSAPFDNASLSIDPTFSPTTTPTIAASIDSDPPSRPPIYVEWEGFSYDYTTPLETAEFDQEDEQQPGGNDDKEKGEPQGGTNIDELESTEEKDYDKEEVEEEEQSRGNDSELGEGDQHESQGDANTDQLESYLPVNQAPEDNSSQGNKLWVLGVVFGVGALLVAIFAFRVRRRINAEAQREVDGAFLGLAPVSSVSVPIKSDQRSSTGEGGDGSTGQNHNFPHGASFPVETFPLPNNSLADSSVAGSSAVASSVAAQSTLAHSTAAGSAAMQSNGSTGARSNGTKPTVSFFSRSSKNPSAAPASAAPSSKALSKISEDGTTSKDADIGKFFFECL